MKPTLEYIGVHTTIGYLTEKEWNNIPYLKDNNGALPPLVIAVGDGRRAIRACEILNLTNVIDLQIEGKKVFGLKGRGRSIQILGTYTQENKSIPILLVETQMGMPPVEVILREVIAHTNPTYKTEEGEIKLDSTYVLRVGTAAGINAGENAPPTLQIGDIVNSSFSIGWSGSTLESLGGLDYSSGETINRFRNKWQELGNSFTEDGIYPLVNNSENLAGKIDLAAKSLNFRVFKGGNFSKDSLYAEIDEESFIGLRTKYNVMSTEMEQVSLGKVASDFNSKNVPVEIGLISGIIGTIPGNSFAIGEEAEEVEKKAIELAANALWSLV